MTEGYFRICTLYVYNDGANTALADVVVAHQADRANARLGALRGAGQIRMFTSSSSGTALTADRFGVILAHEFAHYGLGLGDEYRERLRPESMLAGRAGRLEVGELETIEQSAGRVIPHSLSIRWSATWGVPKGGG